jgi:hypothetical protein
VRRQNHWQGTRRLATHTPSVDSDSTCQWPGVTVAIRVLMRTVPAGGKILGSRATRPGGRGSCTECPAACFHWQPEAPNSGLFGGKGGGPGGLGPKPPGLARWQGVWPPATLAGKPRPARGRAARLRRMIDSVGAGPGADRRRPKAGACHGPGPPQTHGNLPEPPGYGSTSNLKPQPNSCLV